MGISVDYTEVFKKNLTNFMRRFIIMYEIWFHHYTSE